MKGRTIEDTDFDYRLWKRYFNRLHSPDLLGGSTSLLPIIWCRERLNPFPRSKLTRAFNWPLTSIWCRVQECVEL